MIVLINSAYYGAGSTTLTYLLAKTRSTLLNKPSLIISTSNEQPYRRILGMASTWESPTLKVILSKIQTYTEVRTICYRAEEHLYYVNLADTFIKNMDGQRGFNLLLGILKSI